MFRQRDVMFMFFAGIFLSYTIAVLADSETFFVPLNGCGSKSSDSIASCLERNKKDGPTEIVLYPSLSLSYKFSG